jgi:hypothetical protein
VTRGALALGGVVAGLGLVAIVGQAWNAAAILGAVALLLVLRVIYECAAATAIIGRLFDHPGDSSAEVLRELAPLSDH